MVRDDGRSSTLYDVQISTLMFFFIGLSCFIFVAILSVGIGGALWVYVVILVISSIGSAFFIPFVLAFTEAGVKATTGEATIKTVAEKVEDTVEHISLSEISDDNIFDRR